MPGPPRPQNQREQDRYDGDLPDLDADIEGEQACQQTFRWQAKIPQHIGEAKAVDEPEDEGEHPAMVNALNPEVLRRDVGDAEGDPRLDQTIRKGDNLECGQDECNAVSYRESRDNLDENPQSPADDDEGEEEHDVVVADEDVLDPPPGEVCHTSPESRFLDGELL